MAISTQISYSKYVIYCTLTQSADIHALWLLQYLTVMWSNPWESKSLSNSVINNKPCDRLSRVCTSASSCFTLEKQEIGSYPDFSGSEKAYFTSTHLGMDSTSVWNSKSFIYGAFGKYSDPLTFSTFWYVTAVHFFIDYIELFPHQYTHTKPHNDKGKTVFLTFVQKNKQKYLIYISIQALCYETPKLSSGASCFHWSS